MPSSTPYFKMGKPSPREVSRSVASAELEGLSPGPLDAVTLSPPPPPRGARAGGREGCTRAEKDPQMTAEWRRVRLLYSCGLHLVLLRLFF